MKIKQFILIMLIFIALISCEQNNKKLHEGNWCITKIDFSDQNADSIGISEILALNFSKDEQPTKIIITNDSIKLLQKEEVLDVANYKIESKLDENTLLIKIKNKYEGTMSKLEDGYSLKINYITYFYKKCD